MPDIVNLFKKTEEKRKFKKSNYRPWNFMDQMDTEDRQASSSTITIIQNSEEKDGAPEKKQQLQQAPNDLHASKRFNADDNHYSRDPKKELLRTNSNEPNVDRLFRLCGYQKNLFFFIVERCFSRGMLTTGAICNNSFLGFFE